MKYGCCTTMQYYEDLERLGYDYIELQGGQVVKWEESELTEAAQRLKAGRVKCNGFNAAILPEIKIAGPEYSPDATRAYAKELCRRGGLLGIRSIGIGSPNSRKLPEGYSHAQAWDEAEEFLRIFAAEAEPYGITLLWEALNHTECNFGLSMVEGAIRMRRLGLKNLALVCDLYHMALQGEGLEELLSVLPQVRHIHVAQRVGQARCYPRRENLEEYAALLIPAIQGGYDGIIATEAFSGDVVQGAEQAIAIFREIVARAGR